VPPGRRPAADCATGSRRRHQRQRRPRISLGDGAAARGHHAGDFRRIRRALHAQRGRLRDEARLIDQRIELTLRHVRADVEEQQQAADEKEGDDQEGGDEADEDIRQRQLAANPPQHALLSVDEDPVAEDERAGHQRDVAGGVDQLEQGPAAEGEPQREGDRLDQQAGGDRAAAERSRDPAAERRSTRRGTRQERWQGHLSLE
jgi:hypothetical protein